MRFCGVLIGSAMLIAGCERAPVATTAPETPARSSVQAAIQVSYFEPAEPTVPMVQRPAAPPSNPNHNRMYMGTKSQYAQSFTCTLDGYLLALQLSLHNQGDKGDFIVEVTKGEYAEDLPLDDVPVLARVTLPRATIPTTIQASNESPRFITIDLTPFRIPIKKAQVLVLRTSYTSDGNFGLSGVTGNPYGGGQMFQRSILSRFEDNPNPWRESRDSDMAFRVYAAAALPAGPTTQAATITPTRNVTPDGAVIAEALWEPLKPQPADPELIAVRTVRPQRLPPVTLAAAAFESRGRYYLQLTAFNACNSQRSLTMAPVSITVSPVRGGAGVVIDNRMGNGNFPPPYMYGTNMSLGPNEGQIRTYPLGSALDELPAGVYHVSVVLPTETSDKTVDTTLTLAPNCPKPVATTPEVR